MTRYLINFHFSVVEGEREKMAEAQAQAGMTKRSLVPDQAKGGLPGEFLMTIPYFQVRCQVASTSFSDSLKPSPEMNNMDMSSLPVAPSDLIIYLVHKKALNAKGADAVIDAERPITSGCFQIADLLADQTFVRHYAKICRDHKALMACSDEILSDVARRYMKDVFSDYNQNLKQALDNMLTIHDGYCHTVRHLADYQEYWPKLTEDIHTAHRDRMNDIIEKIIPLLVSSYNKWDPTREAMFTLAQMEVVDEIHKDFRVRYNASSTNKYLFSTKDSLLKTNSVWDFLQYYLKTLREVPAFICDRNILLVTTLVSEKNMTLIDSIVDTNENLYECQQFFWSIMQTRFHIYDQAQTPAQKVRLFVNYNPAMAKVIWDSVEYRNILLRAYLRVPNTDTSAIERPLSTN